MADAPSAPASVPLGADVARLAQDFKLTSGKMALPRDAFLKWKSEHEKLSDAEKDRRGADVIALAVRFQREGAEGAVEAIGQLYVLASHLLGKARAEAGFKSAGIGWGPKPKGPASSGGGWGSKR